MENLEEHTLNLYDEFGKDYQEARDSKSYRKLYNDFIEVHSILEAVQNINGKKLLDLGCGSGIHSKDYARRGACVFGVDFSKTMINLAKLRCNEAKFLLANIKNLPFSDNCFDVVTSSLVIQYINDLTDLFREINRVLKKDGLFYYSDHSPLSSKEIYKDENMLVKGIGYLKFFNELQNKSKPIIFGDYFHEGILDYEMFPRIISKYYKRSFRTHLKSIISGGFELIDFIDCKPTDELKEFDAEAYEILSKIPLFSIYVCKKNS